MASTGAATRTKEIEFDLDLLQLHSAHPARYPCLLESTAGGTPQGRYDILFAFPEESLRLNHDGRVTGPGGESGSGFLPALDQWWQSLDEAPSMHASLPFQGGWFLLLGYELAEEIEPSLTLTKSSELPVAIAIRVPVAVIRDRQQSRAWVVCEPTHEACITQVENDIAGMAAIRAGGAAPVRTELTEDPETDFLEAVASAKKCIAAGDIFQANISRTWRGKLQADLSAEDIYRRLRRSNPAPFAGLVAANDFALVSSSPERLLRISGGFADTRPIAGTRPRYGADDVVRRRQLLSNPKERAEHVMLIDLERNDLGRVCEAGTIRVDEFMHIESYRHVHHIVSNVHGKLRAKTTPGEAIRAIFPGGTITGCPKVRCMEVINDLEQRARGFYTGSMGYLNRNGSADLNILIRTMVIVNNEISFAAGSGIVADSDARAELAETRAKAKGLALALQ
jgi:anthranilate synthase component 1